MMGKSLSRNRSNLTPEEGGAWGCVMGGDMGVSTLLSGGLWGVLLRRASWKVHCELRVPREAVRAPLAPSLGRQAA